MKLKTSKISEKKLDNNFKFYLFLKEVNGTLGLTEKEINSLLKCYYSYKPISLINLLNIFINDIEKIKRADKKENMLNILFLIKDNTDLILFVFALKLLLIKPHLLEEAKFIKSSTVIKAKKLHPLSIEYDRIGKNTAYYTRVNGALISLLFFNYLELKKIDVFSDVTTEYFDDLITDYQFAKKKGIEANEIFMLMFSESINQSISSDAGSSYEDIIANLLLKIGITSVIKYHDKSDLSTEYDFFFSLESKTFGISAKRTLRERYKQFIKTAHTTQIDVMIEITLGLDLTEEKAKTIRKHDIYLFVADEVYLSRKFLQDISGIYPGSQFSYELLKSL